MEKLQNLITPIRNLSIEDSTEEEYNKSGTSSVLPICKLLEEYLSKEEELFLLEIQQAKHDREISMFYNLTNDDVILLRYQKLCVLSDFLKSLTSTNKVKELIESSSQSQNFLKVERTMKQDFLDLLEILNEKPSRQLKPFAIDTNIIEKKFKALDALKLKMFDYLEKVEEFRKII